MGVKYGKQRSVQGCDSERDRRVSFQFEEKTKACFSSGDGKYLRRHNIPRRGAIDENNLQLVDFEGSSVSGLIKQ